MELNLTGKVAIVTGASRGIGRAIALLLAQAGARVVVNHIDKLPLDDNHDSAEAVAKHIQSQGGQAVAIRADVSRRSEVAQMVKKSQNFGAIWSGGYSGQQRWNHATPFNG